MYSYKCAYTCHTTLIWQEAKVSPFRENECFKQDNGQHKSFGNSIRQDFYIRLTTSMQRCWRDKKWTNVAIKTENVQYETVSPDSIHSDSDLKWEIQKNFNLTRKYSDQFVPITCIPIPVSWWCKLGGGGCFYGRRKLG